jgi:general secretion pathway protein D
LGSAFPPSPARLRSALFGLTSLALAGCSPGYLSEHSSEPQNAADAVRLADLSPKAPARAPATSPQAQGFQGFSIFGSTTSTQPGIAPAGGAEDETTGAIASPGGDGITLNFESTPIASVAKVVLGDTLGLNYVIDPRAQGSISLSSGRPIPKKNLLYVFESALRANNLSMIREGGGYRITPANEGAIGPIDRGGGTEAGLGMTVIPLRYVSSATITRLLEGFAARPGALRADPTGTLLVVTGSSAERQSALETVRSFDVDWMRGQSVGLYPVHNSGPEPIVAALEKILDSGDGGLGRGLVKVQAISRQNAILVVSAKADMLRAAERWIQRLDSPNSSALSVHVYKVRYGESKQIAQLLSTMFGVGGSATVDSASNQLAPSSGEKALSVTERLTGGRASNNAQPGPDAGGSLGGAQPGAAGGGTGVFGGLQTAALANAMNGGGQGGGDGALPGVRITADVANNSVLVYANSETYRTVERALIQLDRPKSQVAIEATIAEVDLNDNLNYGVQFYLNNRLGSVGNSGTGQPLAATDAPSGFNIIVGNNATPRAIINALHAVTDVRILSNPSLVVQDNQEATLEVGDQVPVSTGSATVLTTSNTIVNTVEYKNTGIILHVLPRISPDNTVSLAIDQEISSVPNNTDATLTPTISERKVKSVVSVVSGQMVLLAGLIADEQDKSRSGVPGLSQLPFVGGAFGTTGKSTHRTELIILIRPQVIRSGEDASEVAEQLRAKMKSGRIPAFSAPDALNVNTRRY